MQYHAVMREPLPRRARSAILLRVAWTRTTMKIGDLVTVEGSQAKSGKPHGNARAVTLAKTGQVLGAGSSQGDSTVEP
jgi:hypothetical protein